MKRVHVIISGMVQGVFFRANTKREADKIGVTGWVRNTDDSVEAVAEGDEAAVDKFVEWCRHGPAAAEVDSINISEEKFRGEFKEFVIKHRP